MPFKKKIYRSMASGGVPFTFASLDDSEKLVDDNVVINNVVSVVDVSKPENQPSFPDRSTFNNLELQIRSGVPLQKVNTVVVHSDDVSEVNARLEDELEIDPLKVNENEN